MRYNFQFANVNEALPALLAHLDSADEVGSRAGRTKEMTHVGISLTEPLDREILLPRRLPNLAAQIAESAWVLAGRDDMEFLSHYLPRAMDFSDDGKRWRAGYGNRLRNWQDNGVEPGQTLATAGKIDQFAWVVDHLRGNPLSRQAVMSIWDPVIDTQPGKDIPCNDWLNFSSRLGYLDLHVALRSNDIIWGWSGINQFEWSVMLEVVAGLLGLEVGMLHFSTTSFHIYDRHFNKAEAIREAAPHPRPEPILDSPRFDASMLETRDVAGLDSMLDRWFRLEYDIRTGSPLADNYVREFPEPMLRSWLQVLQWWWSGGDASYLSDLRGTRLEAAATLYSVQPQARDKIEHGSVGLEAAPEPIPARSANEAGQVEPSMFILATIALHDEKHEAYGDSWKRRGEMLGIMANIARKIDRLGRSDTHDETSADTAADLFVYLAKYRVWLDEQIEGFIYQNWGGTDTPSAADEVMRAVDTLSWAGIEVRAVSAWTNEALEGDLRNMFDDLEAKVVHGHDRSHLVDLMMARAYVLASRLYNVQEGVDEYRGADVD